MPLSPKMGNGTSEVSETYFNSVTMFAEAVQLIEANIVAELVYVSAALSSEPRWH